MSKYQIRLAQSVVKKLSKLPADIENRIIDSVQCLIYNPRPSGVIYQIKDSILTVFILDIGHRKDIYQ